jgi:hypothetical protein
MPVKLSCFLFFSDTALTIVLSNNSSQLHLYTKGTNTCSAIMKRSSSVVVLYVWASWWMN